MDDIKNMLSNSVVDKKVGGSLAKTSSSQTADTTLFEAEVSKRNVVGSERPATGLKNLAEDITKSLTGFKSLRLSMDKDLKRVIVRVVDDSSDRVLRQIPGERMLDLVKQMRDLEGVLEKATA